VSTIEYRPYGPQDAGDVKAMIDDAFSIHKYARAPHLLRSALEVYLRECLAASSYTEVAVVEGRAVGILMGRVQGQPRLPGATANRVRTWAHMAKIALTGFAERKTLVEYFSFNRVYRKLRTMTSGPLTDELTLFAVDASTRGLGVGGALYQNFLDHLRSHGRTDFYLYTDSLCTYQFYERQGMTRVAEQDITLHLDQTPQVVGVYLYAGTAGEGPGPADG